MSELPKTVFVVLRGDDDGYVDSVWATREAAEQYIARAPALHYPDAFQPIEEFTLQTDPNVKRYCWRATYNVHDGTFETSNDVFTDRQEIREELMEEHARILDRFPKVCMLGETEEDAKRNARELGNHLLKLRATPAAPPASRSRG